MSLALDLDAQGQLLKVSAPGACPLTVESPALKSGQTLYRELRPLIDVGPPRPELGFAQRFKVEVKAGCKTAKSGHIVWRQLEGLALRKLETAQQGFVLSALTPSFKELFGDAVPTAQLAVSPRTQGRVLLEATYTHPVHGRQTAELQLSTVSRSRGLPNVPTDASVLLGGANWQLVQSPDGAVAGLSEHGDHTLLRPKAAGKWLLSNANGTELALFSAPYNQMPLDCGRSGCHQSHTTQPVGRMSNVMLRGLSGNLGAFYSVRCTSGCHNLGEPGLNDGGFFATQSQLGFSLHHHTSYDDLPASLKRLSNVGCLGCHGPGAIPEPNARFGILSSSVCAYCHDAPPRYGHVAAWQQNSMSRSQTALNLTQQEDTQCARCHSTWGFLDAQGNTDAKTRIEPPTQRSGISCVACHAVHQAGASANLLRKVKLPSIAQSLPPAVSLDDGTRVCLYCHAPSAAPLQGQPLRSLPEATAAALWLGSGGYSESGESLTAASVHAEKGQGCLGCHAGSKEQFDHGSTHSFRADEQVCKNCHRAPPSTKQPEKRARRLLERLLQKLPNSSMLARTIAPATVEAAKPAHSRAGKLDIETRLGRAAYNLLLVLEDPAAGVHNPTYAELLLDHAERMIE